MDCRLVGKKVLKIFEQPQLLLHQSYDTKYAHRSAEVCLLNVPAVSFVIN